jgi:hypothetical protein
MVFLDELHLRYVILLPVDGWVLVHRPEVGLISVNGCSLG